MDKLVFILILIMFTSCSSKQVIHVEPEDIKDDKVFGDALPEWTDDNGIMNGRLYSVGYAEMAVRKSPSFIQKAALMDGETKLLADAPQDFRVITQRSLTGAGIEDSEFVEIQTRLKEVLGVQGFKHNQKTCRKIVRYTASNKQNVLRGCWYRVSADINKLRDAYEYILEKKYGRGKAKKFENLMNQEIEKINDHKKFN